MLVFCGCASSREDDPAGSGPDSDPVPEPQEQTDFYLYANTENSTVQYIGRGGTVLSLLPEPNNGEPQVLSYRSSLDQEVDEFTVYWNENGMPEQISTGVYDIYLLNHDMEEGCFDALLIDNAEDRPLLLEKVRLQSSHSDSPGTRARNDLDISGSFSSLADYQLSIAQELSEKNIRDRLTRNGTILDRYVSSDAVVETVVNLSNISYDFVQIGMADDFSGRVEAFSSFVLDVQKIWLDSAEIRNTLVQNSIAAAKQSAYHVVLATSERVLDLDFTSAVCSFGMAYYGELAFEDGILGIVYSATDPYPKYTGIPGTYVQFVEPGITRYEDRNYDLRLSGLLPNTTYYYRAFFAYRTAKHEVPVYSSQTQTLKTLGAKTGDHVENEDGNVLIRGEIRYDPNRTYTLLDYGFCYSESVSDPKIGSGVSDVHAVSVQGAPGQVETLLENLTAGRTYHYRTYLACDGEFAYGEPREFKIEEMLVAEPDSVLVEPEGGRFSIRVTSNVPYYVSLPDWVGHIGHEEIDKRDIIHYFSVGEIPEDMSRRVGAIQFYDEARTVTTTVPVTQNQKEPDIVGHWTCVWTTTPPNAKLLYMTVSENGYATQTYYYANRKENETYRSRYTYDGSTFVLYKSNGDIQPWTVRELTDTKLVLVAADGFTYRFRR